MPVRTGNTLLALALLVADGPNSMGGHVPRDSLLLPSDAMAPHYVRALNAEGVALRRRMLR